MEEDRFKSLGEIVFSDDTKKSKSFRRGEAKYGFRNETFHATYWIPETVIGAVIVCHGYGEYLNFGN